MRRKGLLALPLLLCVLLCGCSAVQEAAALFATPSPSPTPTAAPTPVPSSSPSSTASPSPTPEPTPAPTLEPTPEPTPSLTPDPTPELSAEEILLQSMTLEEKVAQMFFVRCPGKDAAEMVSQYQPGGMLLFGRDFRGLSKEKVVQKIESYQAQAKLPLLIGADEEGGDVIRISDNPKLSEEPYWSIRALYEAGGMELLCEIEADKCAMLRGLGVNVNFAPVCDISDRPEAFMYSRSLGLSADKTAACVAALVAVYDDAQVGCVLKHFPGYGNAADTHAGIVYDKRKYETFEKSDFKPFQAGIEAGADCVLVSHSIVSCVDGEAPASLSPAWHAVLRETLGFDGVVITDDLSMGAILDYTDGEAAAVAAVLAGNDMLCCTDYETQIPAALEAVQSGVIGEARINESVLRILRWKNRLGLL